MSTAVFVKIKQNRKKIIACVIILTIALSVFLYYRKVTVPYIVKLSDESIKAEAINTINKSNEKIQRLNAFYGSLFEFVKNNDGDIVLIRSNTTLINQINMYASTVIQNFLNEIVNKDIKIHSGDFLGSVLFAGKGREIDIRVVSIGKCDTIFNSKIYAMGINHALHRLTIDVNISIDVIIPRQSRNTIEVMYEILMGENVIIGKVPTTYLSGENFDTDYIDLIP